MKALPTLLVLLGGWLVPAPAFRLDEAGGVAGVQFGAAATPASGLVRLGSLGKRWRTTQRYTRPGDTTQLLGLGPPPTYWFRRGQFMGVEVALPAAAVPQALQRLTALYGPAHADTLPGHWYWLGQRSYILLGKNTKRTGELFVASLAMLNEQVYETAVRARARRQLAWQPDSVGLPHQFPVR